MDTGPRNFVRLRVGVGLGNLVLQIPYPKPEVFFFFFKFEENLPRQHVGFPPLDIFVASWTDTQRKTLEPFMA